LVSTCSWAPDAAGASATSVAAAQILAAFFTSKPPGAPARRFLARCRGATPRRGGATLRGAAPRHNADRCPWHHGRRAAAATLWEDGGTHR
jgi:hypothetical protein